MNFQIQKEKNPIRKRKIFQLKEPNIPIKKEKYSN